MNQVLVRVHQTRRPEPALPDTYCQWEAWNDQEEFLLLSYRSGVGTAQLLKDKESRNQDPDDYECVARFDTGDLDGRELSLDEFCRRAAIVLAPSAAVSVLATWAMATPLLGPDYPPDGSGRCTFVAAPGAEPCGARATWHVAWTPPNPRAGTINTSADCDLHMDHVRQHYGYFDRHQYTNACSLPEFRWQGPDGCCTAQAETTS
ncbi:hypothetical protein AB0M58_13610 [Streptomyces bobili]|uniref:hypothetical protein n=1 Tax=Streptomyces bobili TaxID=67280 RepID=UPI00343F6AA4